MRVLCFAFFFISKRSFGVIIFQILSTLLNKIGKKKWLRGTNSCGVMAAHGDSLADWSLVRKRAFSHPFGSALIVILISSLEAVLLGSVNKRALQEIGLT